MTPENAQYILQMQEIIQTHGRAIQAVGGGRGELPYMYTVGNTLKGVPEFFAIGITANFVQDIFNQFSDYCLEHLQAGQIQDLEELSEQFQTWWRNDTQLKLSVKGEKVRLALEPGPTWQQHDPRFTMSYQHYIPVGQLSQIKRMQLLWPDGNNRLPDEPGYDSVKFPQPNFRQ